MHKLQAKLLRSDALVRQGNSMWWQPYAELVRLNKPAPILMLYLPSLYGTTLIAILTGIPLYPLVLSNLKLLLGSFLFRSLGCTWNDIVDRDLDRHVWRTRFRPLACDRISLNNALIFAGIQLCVGAGLTLHLFSVRCLLWSLPSVALTILYPTCKSFTDFPQLTLGLVGSWGVWLSFPALDQPLLQSLSPRLAVSACTLYCSYVTWFILIDTVYAAQDITDDLKMGKRSLMTLFGPKGARHLLQGLALIQLITFGLTGVLAGMGIFFHAGTMLLGCVLGYMVLSVDLTDPENCGWWFTWGGLLGASVMAVGFVGEYAARFSGLY